VRHTAHIAVYQSLAVRAVAGRYTPSSADTVDISADSSSLNSAVIALEVENVNTVSCVLPSETQLFSLPMLLELNDNSTTASCVLLSIYCPWDGK